MKLPRPALTILSLAALTATGVCFSISTDSPNESAESRQPAGALTDAGLTSPPTEMEEAAATPAPAPGDPVSAGPLPGTQTVSPSVTGTAAPAGTNPGTSAAATASPAAVAAAGADEADPMTTPPRVDIPDGNGGSIPIDFSSDEARARTVAALREKGTWLRSEAIAWAKANNWPLEKKMEDEPRRRSEEAAKKISAFFAGFGTGRGMNS